MGNIIDSLKGMVSPEMLGQASSSLGETKGGISSALGAAFPSILGGMLNKSSDSSFMGNIFNMSKEQADSPAIDSDRLSREGAEQGGLLDKGRNLLASLFGNRSNDIASSIGQSSGIKPTSALSLLTLAGPMILGFLGRKAKTDGLNAGGLTNFLTSQKDNIVNALPSGLRNMIGVHKPEVARDYEQRHLVDREPEARDREAVNRRERVEEHHHEGSGWKKWVFGLLGLLLLFFVGRGFAKHIKQKREVKKQQEMVMNRPDVTHPAPAASAPNPPEATYGKVTLPNGTIINIPQNSEESKFLAFVKDKSKPVNQNTKFTFNKLTFDKSNSKIDQASQEQVKNIAAIMKAYPTVKVKVVGYTDTDGNKEANMKLSRQRATMVKTELVKQGANTNSITAEGAGEAAANNASQNSNQQDRKVEFIVINK